MFEVIVIIVILLLINQKRLCPQRFQTIAHVPLLEKRNMIDTWARNIQEVTEIKFNGHTLYYNIHANNINTDKVDYITICTEYISKSFFEIKPSNFIDKILIKLNIYHEIKIQNRMLNNLVLVLVTDKKSSTDIFDETMQKKLIDFFSKEKTFSFKYLKLTNCGEEFCLKFKMRKDLKKKDIDIDRILNDYVKDFLLIFEELKTS